jgi:hypothetical protein
MAASPVGRDTTGSKSRIIAVSRAFEVFPGSCDGSARDELGMVSDAVRQRMEAALGSSDPASALVRLARELKTAGMDKDTMYGLFGEYQNRTEADDPRYDAIVDTMDLICGGPWARGRGLFDAG